MSWGGGITIILSCINRTRRMADPRTWEINTLLFHWCSSPNAPKYGETTCDGPGVSFLNFKPDLPLGVWNHRLQPQGVLTRNGYHVNTLDAIRNAFRAEGVRGIHRGLRASTGILKREIFYTKVGYTKLLYSSISANVSC